MYRKTSGCQDKGINKVCCPPGTRQDGSWCYPEEKVEILDFKGKEIDNVVDNIDTCKVIGIDNICCPPGSRTDGGWRKLDRDIHNFTITTDIVLIIGTGNSY